MDVIAGDGDDSKTTVPLPVIATAAGDTCCAVDPPVFETVIITVIIFPSLTVAGIACMLDTSVAGLSMLITGLVITPEFIAAPVLVSVPWP